MIYCGQVEISYTLMESLSPQPWMKGQYLKYRPVIKLFYDDGKFRALLYVIDEHSTTGGEEVNLATVKHLFSSDGVREMFRQELAELTWKFDEAAKKTFYVVDNDL